jgi:hypothetical protein
MKETRLMGKKQPFRYKSNPATSLKWHIDRIDECRHALWCLEDDLTELLKSDAEARKLAQAFWAQGGVTRSDFESWMEGETASRTVPSKGGLRLVVKNTVRRKRFVERGGGEGPRAA